MTFTPNQWLIGGLAAFLVGLSKTGVPGVGILTVPLMASLFAGRISVGTLLPMLLMADVFAVAWYRRHARWDKLWQLFPWVAVGVVLGACALWQLAQLQTARDIMNPLIGIMVLLMLGVHFARQKMGDRLVVRSSAQAATAGTLAGFSTTVANAAGPVMGIYLTSLGLPKDQFMGTTAWYFLLINLFKIPFYVVLTRLTPNQPFFTANSLTFNLAVAPLIVGGAFLGKWLLPRLQQHLFDGVILALAAFAALRLLFV
jgi:uncharacterized membrane protein YfcA